MTHKRELTVSSIDEKGDVIDSAYGASPAYDSFPGFPKVRSPAADSTGYSVSSDELEPTVPPDHRHRTLVLCFDGTGGSGTRCLLCVVLMLAPRRPIRRRCAFYATCAPPRC